MDDISVTGYWGIYAITFLFVYLLLRGFVRSRNLYMKYHSVAPFKMLMELFVAVNSLLAAFVAAAILYFIFDR